MESQSRNRWKALLTEGEAEDRTDGGQVTAADNDRAPPNGESEGAVDKRAIEGGSVEHGDESNDAGLAEGSEKPIIAEIERNYSAAEASTLNSGLTDGEAASIDAESLISDPHAITRGRSDELRQRGAAATDGTTFGTAADRPTEHELTTMAVSNDDEPPSAPPTESDELAVVADGPAESDLTHPSEARLLLRQPRVKSSPFSRKDRRTSTKPHRTSRRSHFRNPPLIRRQKVN
jgi:hypothetical protein